MAGGDALGSAVVEDAHRTAGGGTREIGGDQALGRRPLLGAEAAAHELAGHVHAIGIEPECAVRARARASQMPCVETYACSSSPSHCATRAVRLERVLHLGRRGVLGLDDDVGLGHAGLDVAALVLDRILLQPLLGQGLGRVDHEAEHRCSAGSSASIAARAASARLARERRHRRARVGRLALEDRPAALPDVVVRGREHGVYARHGAAQPSTSSSTVACACGERTMTPCSMPGSATSET